MARAPTPPPTPPLYPAPRTPTPPPTPPLGAPRADPTPSPPEKKEWKEKKEKGKGKGKPAPKGQAPGSPCAPGPRTRDDEPPGAGGAGTGGAGAAAGAAQAAALTPSSSTTVPPTTAAPPQQVSGQSQGTPVSSPPAAAEFDVRKAAVLSSYRKYLGLNLWPRSFACDEPERGYDTQRMFNTLPSRPPFYAAQFFGEAFVFDLVGDKLCFVCTTCHKMKTSEGTTQYPLVHICEPEPAPGFTQGLHVPNCVAILCRQCVQALEAMGHYEWRDFMDGETRVPARCMNCSGDKFFQWHNFHAFSVVPNNREKMAVREEYHRDNGKTGMVSGLHTWSLFLKHSFGTARSCLGPARGGG